MHVNVYNEIRGGGNTFSGKNAGNHFEATVVYLLAEYVIYWMSQKWP